MRGVELPSSRDKLRWLHRLQRGRDMRSSASTPYQTRPLAITGDGDFAISALFGEGLRVWICVTLVWNHAASTVTHSRKLW